MTDLTFVPVSASTTPGIPNNHQTRNHGVSIVSKSHPKTTRSTKVKKGYFSALRSEVDRSMVSEVDRSHKINLKTDSIIDFATVQFDCPEFDSKYKTFGEALTPGLAEEEEREHQKKILKFVKLPAVFTEEID